MDVPDNYEIVNALALLPDGRVVLAGTVRDTGYADIAVARLLPDGAPDTSFGTEGITITDLRSDEVQGDDNVRAMVARPDGSLVVSGTVYAPMGRAFVAAYRPDGSLDARFGGAGWVSPPSFSGGEDGDEAYALTLSGQGRPVIAVFPAGASRAGSDVTLARFRRDGSLDATFGEGGIARVDLGGDEVVVALATQPDGKLLAVGSTGDSADGSSGEVAVTRFHG